MKELISNDLINRIRESKSNAEARRYILTAIQKAKQKQAIEESTNWQMKEEKPELSVEEFLNKHTPFLVRSYRGCSAVNPFVSASARQQVIKHLANKLTEFKNLNG